MAGQTQPGRLSQITARQTVQQTAEQLGEAIFRRQGQRRAVKRQTVLYSPGQPATAVFWIAEGEVKVCRNSPDGRELTLDFLAAGEVFGELEVLLQTARESQAVARTDLVVFTLEKAALLAAIEAEPRLGIWLAQRISLRQARMTNRLEALVFKSAHGKVAQVLLSLAQAHGRPTADGTLIDYPITHQEIGNLIATTRETVSYAFMEFRQRGLISTKQRRTIVRDLDGLGELALA
jgi:CRP/FNR family transcriptional regulator